MANRENVQVVRSHRKLSGDVIAVNITGYVLIGLFALFCLLPFYLIVIASFTPNADLIRTGYPIIPTSWTLEAYQLCIKNPITIIKAYGTTIGVTLTGTLIADIVLQLLSYVAQTERELIRQRQAEGIAAAKARGVHMGRYPIPIPEEFGPVYEQWKAGELSGRAAARQLGVSPHTFGKWTKLQ